LVFAYFFRRWEAGEGYVNFIVADHDLFDEALNDLALVINGREGQRA
jgi:hypothetical protein